MKKLIVFIFSIVLLGSCGKEWHDERRVNFFFIPWGTSFNNNDGIVSEVNCTIEYKIVGDPNADTSTVNIADLNWGESQVTGVEVSYDHKLMSYDHLEFKVTTSFINVKPINYELEFRAYTSFRHNTPDDRTVMEIIHTVNNPDTTIYFTWSPHNLPLH